MSEQNYCPIAVSVIQAARYLNLGRTKIYELIRSGDLKALKIGRRTLISMASIHALAKRAA